MTLTFMNLLAASVFFRDAEAALPPKLGEEGQPCSNQFLVNCNWWEGLHCERTYDSGAVLGTCVRKSSGTGRDGRVCHKRGQKCDNGFTPKYVKIQKWWSKDECFCEPAMWVGNQPRLGAGLEALKSQVEEAGQAGLEALKSLESLEVALAQEGERGEAEEKALKSLEARMEEAGQDLLALKSLVREEAGQAGLDALESLLKEAGQAGLEALKSLVKEAGLPGQAGLEVLKYLLALVEEEAGQQAPDALPPLFGSLDQPCNGDECDGQLNCHYTYHEGSFATAFCVDFVPSKGGLGDMCLDDKTCEEGLVSMWLPGYEDEQDVTACHCERPVKESSDEDKLADKRSADVVTLGATLRLGGIPSPAGGLNQRCRGEYPSCDYGLSCVTKDHIGFETATCVYANPGPTPTPPTPTPAGNEGESCFNGGTCYAGLTCGRYFICERLHYVGSTEGRRRIRGPDGIPSPAGGLGQRCRGEYPSCDYGLSCVTKDHIGSETATCEYHDNKPEPTPNDGSGYEGRKCLTNGLCHGGLVCTRDPRPFNEQTETGFVCMRQNTNGNAGYEGERCINGVTCYGEGLTCQYDKTYGLDGTCWRQSGSGSAGRRRMPAPPTGGLGQGCRGEYPSCDFGLSCVTKDHIGSETATCEYANPGPKPTPPTPAGYEGQSCLNGGICYNGLTCGKYFICERQYVPPMPSGKAQHGERCGQDAFPGAPTQCANLLRCKFSKRYGPWLKVCQY